MQPCQFILGSSSPRRVELLKQIGLNFKIIKPETEELIRDSEPPEDYVIRNAQEKAHWVGLYLLNSAKERFDQHPVIISADTIVVIDQKTLEKPANHADAFRMLKTLSGRTHTVMTGVTLIGPSLPGSTVRDWPSYDKTLQMVSFRVHTKVHLKHLADAEINCYIASGEPLDKAGAYAAQGVGSYMVERIEGSYANVVGLPVCEVVKKLDESFGIKLWETFPRQT